MTSRYLKFIALITMTIDHIGAIYYFYSFRIVGRIAFPLFAFLIATGFKHTKDSKKFLSRLLIFAIIAEPFFNLFVNSVFYSSAELSFFNLSSQNVLFTFLFSGFFIEICKKDMNYFYKSILLFLICTVAYFFNADYGLWGMLLPVVFYFTKRTPFTTVLVMIIFSVLFYERNIYLILGFLTASIFILMYNNSAGAFKNEFANKLYKWAFYIYYPLHMLILSLIKL